MSELLFSLEGRINRKPYWMFMLAVIIGTVITTVIDMATTGEEVGVTSIIFMLLMVWPSLVIQVKRWHDIDKSGWWVLINIIPIIGPIWALVENGFFTGTKGDNRFGNDPLR